MGLRLLPWVLGYRRRSKDASLFDCEKCMTRTTRIQRQRMNCGWLPPHERRGPGVRIDVPFKFPDPDVADQCPGWLIRLPQVYEAQVAYMWSERGQLRDRYPTDNLECLMDCVQLLGSEQSAFESFDLENPVKS